MGKTTEYSCAKCGTLVGADDETCPSCGANLSGHRLIRLAGGGGIGQTATLSTAIYAPPGRQPSKEELGRLKKAIRAIWTEMKKWEVEGANVGIPPFVVRMKRRGT
jgi:hypothetical protein